MQSFEPPIKGQDTDTETRETKSEVPASSEIFAQALESDIQASIKDLSQAQALVDALPEAESTTLGAELATLGAELQTLQSELTNLDQGNNKVEKPQSKILQQTQEEITRVKAQIAKFTELMNEAKTNRDKKEVIDGFAAELRGQEIYVAQLEKKTQIIKEYSNWSLPELEAYLASQGNPEEYAAKVQQNIAAMKGWRMTMGPDKAKVEAAHELYTVINPIVMEVWSEKTKPENIQQVLLYDKQRTEEKIQRAQKELSEIPPQLGFVFQEKKKEVDQLTATLEAINAKLLEK